MDFYSRIASYYDLLFPFDPIQAAFLQKIIQKGAKNNLLDIGCATGTIISHFSGDFKRLVGLDLDEQLLKRAAEKMYPGLSDKVELIAGNMTELKHFFSEDEFSFITSFGNTIPRLVCPGEIPSFLKSVYSLLEPKGVFVFQTINFNRVLDKGLRGLPQIERDDVCYERYYSLPDSNGIITFDTILSDPEQSLEMHNSARIVPVTKERMEEYLSEAGFSHLTFYGDYKGGEFTSDSYFLIGVCTK